jgi:alpha-amylase
VIPARLLSVVAALTVVASACTSGSGGAQSTGSALPPGTISSSAPASPSPSAVPTPPPYQTPEWFKHAVLYEIFVRSFADSNGDGIGDLDGITTKLDYLRSLGVTAVWLTPIFASPSYHGYDTTDYDTINPDFGTTQDLQELVDAAHAKGIKVILDFVASHTSNLFPYFEDAYGNPASPYSDWYVWKDPAHRIYQSFANIPTLPSVNHLNPDVNRFYVDVAKRWMDLDGDGDYTDGVDGFRCDYALGSPHAFWKQLRAELKPLNPDVLLLGEVWQSSPSALAPYYDDQFDALFDFPVYLSLQGDPQASGDGVLNGGFLSALTNTIRGEQGQFPPEGIPVRFAGNHDTDRISTEEQGDRGRERLAAAIVATMDGTPQLYYGEEIGMTGHKGAGPIYDEYRREPMEWYGSDSGPDQPTWFEGSVNDVADDGVSVQEQDGDPDSLLSFYRTLYELRTTTAFGDGDFALLPTSEDGVWAFWRWDDTQVLSAVFNFNETKTTFSLDTTTAPTPLADVPTDLLGNGGALNPSKMTLPASGFVLLEWIPARS